METNDIVLDTSVIRGDSHKIDAFLSDRDIEKFLFAIRGDVLFKIDGHTLYFLGEEKSERKIKRRYRRLGSEGPQQIRLFQSLDDPPQFTNHVGAAMNLRDMYHGCTGFLILSGPSTRTLDLDLLRQPGLLKMGVNNSPKVVRPNLWTCVDPPDKFLKSVWYDPTIMKFVRGGFRGKTMWDNSAKQLVPDRTIGDCPNIVYVKMNTVFTPDTWIREQTFNWGNNGSIEFIDPATGEKTSGTRSCMLVALKLMITLGVRTIFLVGADFSMDLDQPYGFDQEKHQGGCNSNNSAYRHLNVFLNVLRPRFEEMGVRVFNTNKDSGLKTFDFVAYEDAIAFALSEIGDLNEEVTAGHYSSKTEKKAIAKAAGVEERGKKTSGRWIPGKGWFDEGEEVPDNPMLSMLQTETVKKRITIEQLWLNRDRIVEVFPTMSDLKEGLEKRVAKIEEHKGKEKTCKGCELRRIVSPFIKLLLREIVEAPELFVHAGIFNLESPVTFRKETFTFQEIVDAGLAKHQ